MVCCLLVSLLYGRITYLLCYRRDSLIAVVKGMVIELQQVLTVAFVVLSAILHPGSIFMLSAHLYVCCHPAFCFQLFLSLSFSAVHVIWCDINLLSNCSLMFAPSSLYWLSCLSLPRTHPSLLKSHISKVSLLCYICLAKVKVSTAYSSFDYI